MYDGQRLKPGIILAHSYGIALVRLPGGGLRPCIARISDVESSQRSLWGCRAGSQPLDGRGDEAVAVGEGESQKASCSERMDAGERCLGDGITRAEVMEYLSQTYGPVFVADLVKHLS